MKYEVFRETALPVELKPYAIYLIAPADRPDYVEMYVVDATGRKPRRHINEQDVRTLINQAMSTAGQLTVVDNIAARNAIQNPKGEVMVLDATGDPSVSTGGARYLYSKGSWVKTAETESMDLRLSWDAIEGKPNVSKTQLENAVSHSHQHENMTQLGKIGEDVEGNLTYGGKVVGMQYSSLGW